MLDSGYNSVVEYMTENNVIQTEQFRDMDLLVQIEQNPDISQAGLAQELGVAVGTINWHIKRLVAKGYVKVKRAQRKKLRYIITPEGLALRARLTIDYVRNQFDLYRRIRECMLALISEIGEDGHRAVRLVGEGEIAEVCRLTCMEHNVAIIESDEIPCIIIEGLKIRLEHPVKIISTIKINPMESLPER
jgi:DNA-binding MarR family transcriptional regulator